MKSFATDRELQLKKQLFACTDVRNIPLSFCCDGQQFRGIPEDFSVAVSRQDNGVTDIIATNAQGLEIHAQYREYADYAATEWLVFFTNKGSAPTPVISHIRLGGLLPLPADTLYHGNGDTRGYGGYRWKTTPLAEKPVLCPDDGTSCNGAFPYMRLIGEDLGINLAIGWSGKWVAHLAPADGGVEISVGQARCNMRILPGETIRPPPADPFGL